MIEWLAALGIGYAVLVAYMFAVQRRYVYLPSRDVVGTPRDEGMPYEDVRLAAPDGNTVAGWYLPASPSRGCVLFCHGNGGNIGDQVDLLKVLHGLGVDVFAFDYRGYGRSGGSPSERRTYEDAMAAWRHLTEARRIPRERIVVFGWSLGGAVAAWLAKEVTPGGLIVESAFTSMPDVAQKLYWYLPARWLCRFRYGTREYVSRVRCPVLVAHSADDDMIPLAHGQAIFDAAPQPKAFLEMRGGHNDMDFIGGETYRLGLDGFLTQCLGPAGGR